MGLYWNLELAQMLKTYLFNINTPIILLFISTILAWKNKIINSVKYLITFSLLLLTFFSSQLTSKFLICILLSNGDKKLESNFSSNHIQSLIQTPSCVQHLWPIIVLGGGLSYINTPSPYAFSRLLGLGELLNSYPYNSSQTNSKKVPIIFSGGKTSEIEQSEAEIFYKYALYLYGNSLSNFEIITENKSLNTFQNAFFSNSIFTEKLYEKNIVLITNTFHMARAKKTFEAQGFTVCPVSVSSNNLYGSGIFNFQNAINNGVLLNEFFGIMGYLIKGWIHF